VLFQPLILIIIGVLVVAAGAVYVLREYRPGAPELPPLPAIVVDEFATPIQEQIRAAYRAVQQPPDDAALNRHLEQRCQEPYLYSVSTI